VSVDSVLVVLRGHRYSASPWFCRCGVLLVGGDLFLHVAEMVVVSAGGGVGG